MFGESVRQILAHYKASKFEPQPNTAPDRELLMPGSSFDRSKRNNSVMLFDGGRGESTIDSGRAYKAGSKLDAA